MERKLASIQIIRDIEPIPDAEFIETAIVNNWKIVVAKKDGFKVGDKVIINFNEIELRYSKFIEKLRDAEGEIVEVFSGIALSDYGVKFDGIVTKKILPYCFFENELILIENLNDVISF